MSTSFERAATAFRAILLIVAVSAAFGTSAFAAESSIIFGNASNHEADIVVDRTYTCHAPPTVKPPRSICLFTSSCANIITSDRDTCIVAALQPGKHSIVVRTGGRTLTVLATQKYFKAEGDAPAEYANTCRLDYTANTPRLHCNGP